MAPALLDLQGKLDNLAGKDLGETADDGADVLGDGLREDLVGQLQQRQPASPSEEATTATAIAIRDRRTFFTAALLRLARRKAS